MFLRDMNPAAMRAADRARSRHEQLHSSNAIASPPFAG
ncbi:hypothetical protein AZ78_3517 [Lysobacter capsici AZ78]|uniref:Uncharacterized protein n=1 Tax=Lysobacter capsici AZ78 TaxID=1444315 RepID=A0A120AHC6_9GAMM|nr:hypothetical protein AZ78_3517 [Lysobacter capsici AZ78]